jgi:hypothetical protein
MPHPFEFESLWNKAKLFMERGLAARSEHKEEEWPLWASLASELLGKAVLSRRHPVLIAHPGSGEDAANSLLSAAGIETKEGGLQSIQMKTVLLRLSKVLPTEFDAKVQISLKLIADYRNEELHSGATPYTELKEHAWAPGFWRAVDILLKDIGKSVQEFVGPEFEHLVVELIAATYKEVEDEVKKRFGLAKEKWKVRSDDAGGEEAYRKLIIEKVSMAGKAGGELTTCPVCSCLGRINHSGVQLSSVRQAGDDEILVENRYRAEQFSCEGCSLQLEGTAFLAKAGLPVDITEMSEYSLEAYDYEEEYGND